MEEIENLEFEIRALQDRVESLTEELKKPTNPMNGLTGLPDQVTSLNRRLLTLQYQINRFEEILSDSDREAGEGVGTVEEKLDELTKQLNFTNSKVDSLQDSLTREFKSLDRGLVFTYLTVLAWLLFN